MANEQNLVRGDEAHKLTAEEQSRGGKASGKARREKRKMREALEELLAREYSDNNGNTVDGTMALMTRTFKQAMDGDMQAIRFIRETTGQDPVQRIEQVEISPEVYERVARALEGE